MRTAMVGSVAVDFVVMAYLLVVWICASLWDLSNLPFVSRPTGRRGGNSAHRLAAVWDRVVVLADLAAELASLAGPVLLVDDLADSRWTSTVAARALRRAGADEVLPFVLALDG